MTDDLGEFSELFDNPPRGIVDRGEKSCRVILFDSEGVKSRNNGPTLRRT